MRTIKIVFSVGYSIGQVSLGLFLHPYQTMQSLVADRVFVWMSLLPTLMLGLVTLGWREVTVPVVRVFFSCQTNPILACSYIEFVSNWLTFFCIYWQVLLLYLLFRFNRVWRED